MSNERLRRISDLIQGIEREECNPLLLYRPYDRQEPMHRSKASELLVWGGKRSGKSVCVSMEFVSRILGRPITTQSGEKIPLRWPVSSREAPRQYWIVGWDGSHSNTIHKLLFQPGQGGTLRCIRDLETGKWRLWNRANPEDAARIKESKLTPPLIPPEIIVGGEDGIAWEDKKNKEWKSVTLVNGAVIYYWPSSQLTAKPGEAVSGIWIDEDIQIPSHLKEWQDRLTDMEGWFMWSVWPQTRNDALLQLKDRAEASEGDENSVIQQFQLVMTQNPFITEKGKQAALQRMETDEEVARRDRGEMLLDSLLMYDFAPIVHCLRHADFDRRMEAEMHTVRWTLTRLLTEDGRFPRNWTRYLSIDPSNTRTACHSWVVPPPLYQDVQMGNIAIVEWELVVERYGAEKLAAELRTLMAGLQYEAFVMDQQMGRQTSVGRDETVFQHYEMAFREQGLVSRLTLSGFMPGCNEPPTRRRTVRRMLSVQPNGMPMLLFVEERIPQTKKEFHRFKKKMQTTVSGNIILDEPANPRVFDCMASVEYGATFICQLMDQGIAYQELPQMQREKSPILQKVEELQRRDRDSQDEYVHLGPGARA